jgi:hypothetical protein
MRIWLLLGAALAVAVGCSRDAESLRAELAAKQAVWQRELGAFKAQHTAMAERLARQKKAVAGTDAPPIVRMRATLNGVAQSLLDVEIQMRQAAARLDQALTRGGDAAQKALAEDIARMDGYVQALAGDMVATGRALDDFDRASTGGENANGVDQGG